MSDMSISQHGSFVNDARSGSEVVDRRDERLVVRVELVEEFLDERVFDSAEQFSDRLLSSRTVLDGDRSLEDTDSLGISIKDRLDIIALPEGILKTRRQYSSFVQERCARTFLNQILNEASSTGIKGTG